MAGPTIIARGNDEQKARYLSKILSAEEIWCQGFSEPGAGSDLAAVRTRAVRNGDHYVVNGQKVWSSYAHLADWCILVTLEDPDAPRYQGLTYLLVDMHSPGVETRPLTQITGEAEFNEIFFTDVEVPVENVVGEPGDGWAVAMTTLMHERAALGFALSGAFEVAVGKLLELARGRDLDDRLRDLVAQSWIDLQALKWTNYRALTRLMETGAPGPEASIPKLHWSEANQRLGKLALELLGPGGAGPGRRRLLAVAPAPQPRQHDRGRDVGDPPQHRRRARARPPEGALMHFAFTPEQEALRAEARRWLDERYPHERVAELADSEAGWDPASWAELAELGWLGVSVSEDEGGAGLGFLEEAVLFEELGRALYPGPYFSTVALALPRLGPEDRAAVAAGEARWSAQVDGLVPDLALVDRVLTADGAVAAEGETVKTMDATRRLGRLAAARRATPRSTAPAAYAALALEAVGIAQRALDWGVEHAKDRQQFGKSIGVYQAVSHSLVDAMMATELARSLAYWAAWCVAEGDEQAATAAAAAKAYAAEAAVSACERSIQVHGGIGFTWEHPLHRFYKRAQWIQAFDGFPAAQRAEIAAAILA